MSCLFAGLDWGGERHAVCVVDEAGKVVVQFEVVHDAEGLASMLKRLGKLAPPGELAYPLRRPRTADLNGRRADWSHDERKADDGLRTARMVSVPPAG